jgi:radical SAM protein with 4Fe4S-binding SPASM domain
MKLGDFEQEDTNNSLRKSQAFCRAAFENLHLAIGGDVKPCCEFAGQVGSIKDNTIAKIWHSESLKELRLKMIRDERDQRCWKCYEEEASGGQSLRDLYNARFGENASPTSHTSTRDLPRTLDLRFSNLCNLSCRTCGPGASTKWYNDAKRLGRWRSLASVRKEPFASTAAALNALRPALKSVEGIYFAGGEPLLHEAHYAVLNELLRLDRANVGLSYNTNLTALELGGMQAIPLWLKFKHVHIGASIDGYEKQGELIREGLSWQKFAKNLSTIREQCPHVQIVFAITVSVFNVLALPDLCRRLREIDPGGAKFNFSLLQEPRFYSVQILPKAMKEEAKRRLEELGEKLSLQDELKPIVSFMMFQDRSNQLCLFRFNTLRLDEIRNQNTAEIIPELAPLLREPVPERYMRKTAQSLIALANAVCDKATTRN